MKKNKIIRLVTLSFIIIFLSQHFFIKKNPKNISKSQAFVAKTQYAAQNSQIKRIEINIYDDTTKDYFDIIEVEFNYKQIYLLDPDASGRRARVYFQEKPGKYLLQWKISTSGYEWPRYKTYKKIIEVKEVDRFINILIVGDKIKIS